ncbi:MAG: lipoyl synthase [Oscillospiraceae bacterium]|jgi:lipoic acid synthetase|nr:lipoyl synthase [Oscillospiraceae bacterium]
MDRKPPWLRRPLKTDPNQGVVEHVLKDLRLNTVCREANCPNYQECFAAKTATFMILGTHCTRDCRFCNVTHGTPQPVNPNEPERVAQAAARLGLRYAVVTSVTRDDLPDGGASHFAQTVRAFRALSPDIAVETLVPDFAGDMAALAAVTAETPDVVSHNVETVPALYARVRPGADYPRSLALLAAVKRQNPQVRSKTGFMLGLGETEEQVLALLADLREAGCEFLTVGQYLAPTKAHLPVERYVPPEEFDAWAARARAMGFAFVAAAPLVRSSYHAGEAVGLG